MALILPDTLAGVFIASFPAGPWQTNCYLVATAAGEECVIVDPGMDAVGAVAGVVAEHHLKPVAVLVTHGHLDHTFSVAPLCREHAATCWVHPRDRRLLTDPLAAMGPETRLLLQQLSPEQRRFTEPEDVHELVDGAEFDVAGLRVTGLHAPGHTAGSVMFSSPYEDPESELGQVVFSGDVLFAGSIGRTDLPGGDGAAMRESLRTAVLGLPDDAAVLPGHGPATTMARERRSNPYLQPAFLDPQPRDGSGRP